MANSYEKRLIRVLEYIFDNPAGDLSLDRLAEVAAMSRFHWHRVFHAMTGETCAEAVRRIRLHRAALWLVQTDRPMARIAIDCGYGSVQSFSRAFREDYRLTPGQFRKRGAVERALINDRKGTYPMYTVEFATQPERHLIGLNHTGPYTEIGKAFESLSTIITSRNRWADVRGLVGVYFDDPNAVAPQDLHSFAGMAVDAGAAGEDGLEALTLEGGDYVVLHYKGPYSGIQNAYHYLFGDWLPNSDYEPRNAPNFEIYLNSPVDTPPEELLTEIYTPFKPLAG